MEYEESFYQELLNNLHDGVYFVDPDRHITFWNNGAERITGYPRGEVLGRCCADNILMHVNDEGHKLCLGGCPLAASIADGAPREAEVFLHHKEGHRIPVLVRVAPLRNRTGTIIGAVELFSDNSTKAELASQLIEMEKLALLDPLTGLANRRYLEMHIHSRLAEYERNGWIFGMLFVDIDHFKKINDTLGHDVGDKVIRMVGKTLDAGSRVFDRVGRWGGEEFIVVIANANQQMVLEIGERLRNLVAQSSLSDPVHAYVTISIGVALVQPGDTLESLVRRSDEKMYRAKRGGRNRICS